MQSCKDAEHGSVAYEDGYKLFNLEKTGWKSRTLTHDIKDIAYKATLVPIQYYILKNEGSQNPQKVDSIYSAHKKERILEIEFQGSSKGDLLDSKYTNKDYQSAVEYMAFKMENDFKVVTQAGDTVSCAGVVFERNFKLAPFKRLLLHFGGIPEEDDIELVYVDRLFGNGTLQYKFKETPLKL